MKRKGSVSSVHPQACLFFESCKPTVVPELSGYFIFSVIALAYESGTIIGHKLNGIVT